MQTKKRAFLGVVVVAMLVGMSLPAGSAFAAPPNRTSITLACDRDASASASVTLLADSGAPVDTLTVACGFPSGVRRDRVVVDSVVPVNNVNITVFRATTAAGTTSCATGVTPLPYRGDCVEPTAGAGATLTVR